MPRRYVLILVAVLALGTFAIAPRLLTAQDEKVTFDRDRLTIRTAAGEHAFEIELAETPEQRSRGLMFRDHLAPDAGMLFVFEAPREASFWMKNTLVSLDMLFIDATGSIVRIAAETTPESEAPIPSGGLVKGVLEIAGGRAAALGIAVGDRVLHPSFRTGS
ncbi:MAG: DUF192 domain-containing protein [Alphaproteobacteria bacterium]